MPKDETTTSVPAGSGRLYRQLVQASSELIALLDPDGRFAFVSAACRSILGYEPRELCGRRLDEVLRLQPGEDGARLAPPELCRGPLRREVQAERREGSPVELTLSTTPILGADGSVHSIVAVFTNIAEQIEVRRRLEQLVHEDELTDLPNRRAFLSELDRHLRHAMRYGPRGAILMIDLDRFKQVNDDLGHPVGDALLRVVATRLRVRLRATDLLARLQGDEFVVLLPEADCESAIRVAEAIQRSVRKPVPDLDESRSVVTVSVGGIVIDRLVGRGDLMAFVDAALREAKRGGQGKGGVRVHKASRWSRLVPRRDSGD
jgi:diguanylate cyclase (GGDEF)-like protein/PAS domain S-box-containing protein